MVAWDDPDVAWHALPLCVLRSTWNYPHHPDAFIAWARRVAAVTRLYNPLAIVDQARAWERWERVGLDLDEI